MIAGRQNVVKKKVLEEEEEEEEEEGEGGGKIPLPPKPAFPALSAVLLHRW